MIHINIVKAAEDRLKALLAEAGFDMNHPLPAVAWPVLKRFYQEEIPEAENDFLFECGTFKFGGNGPEFHFGFCRQFSFFDEEGEYCCMHQLHCDFMMPASPEMGDSHISLWAFDYPDLNAYFTAVEESSFFKFAIGKTEWRCEVIGEQV